MSKIDALAPAKPLKEQIEGEYQDFTSEAIANKSNLTTSKKSNNLRGVANPDRINQNIESRYQNLVETNSEKIDLFTANKMTNNLLGNEVENQQQSQPFLDNTSIIESNDNLFSKTLTAGVGIVIIIVGSILLLPLVNAFLNLDGENGLSFLGLSFGKPKVPEDAIALHNKTFKEIADLAHKAEKIDNEKFGQKEFILYLKLRYKVSQGVKEYQNLGLNIKYLEAAIIAQNSYLKIEQTELRYRSRKQQAFYQFVIDNITDNIDKNVFQEQVKTKLAEVIPLVNTEEGKEALKAYLQ